MVASSQNGKIQNTVLNALLESFYDILDRDGRDSILRYAGCPDLDWLDPQSDSSLEVFKNIMSSMNELLCFSTVIMNEIGRKFTIYSDPRGSGIERLVDNLKDWIKTPWNVEIVENTPEKVVVKVENCPFCTHQQINGSENNCEILCGMFTRAVAETSRHPENVTCTAKNHVFTILKNE
ncbi:MAG: hypothetical protein ACTSU5_14820 [Promethearchaeota archaeon]